MQQTTSSTRQITVYDRNGARQIPFETAQPLSLPAQDTGMYAMFSRLMDSAQTIHTADPVSRGVAMLIKTSAITLFLSAFTLAGLVMFDSLTFFLWLLLASGEWVLCFLYLAYNDWREHPTAVRWTLANGFLYLMQREQDARFKLQGIDPKDID